MSSRAVIKFQKRECDAALKLKTAFLFCDKKGGIVSLFHMQFHLPPI